MTQSDTYNTTSLHESAHGQTVHRDYIAHALRWGFAFRFLKAGMTVIDVGCGTDTPFEKVIAHFPRPPIPRKLSAIDFNRFTPKINPKWIDWHLGVDVLTLDPAAFDPADLVTCFEVIEHMDRDRGIELLKWLRAVTAESGTLLLSTPSYDGVHKAKNHIHEWEKDELRQAVEEHGFRVVNRFGTFMNVKSAERQLEARFPECLLVWDMMRTFYADEVMSTLFAPLFPDDARNILWQLKPA